MQKHRDTNSTHTHTSCGSGGCAALMRRIVCTGRRWGCVCENLTAPFERCRSQNIPGHTERHRHAAPHRQPRKTSRTRASVQAGPTATPTPTHTHSRERYTMSAASSNESLFTSAAVEAAAAVSSHHRSASAAKARPPRRRRRSTRARRPHACPACTGIPARAPPRRARATGGTRTAGGAKATGRSTPAARGPATCAAMGTGGERQPGIGQARVPVEVRSRRRAPRQPTGRPGGHAARTRALSAPSSAVGRHACGRPRWTARRAPSSVPRGLRGDPPAAAVRGAASAPVLAHAPAHKPGCRSPPAPIAAQVAGVRAAGDGGALPRAVARRAGSPV